MPSSADSVAGKGLCAHCLGELLWDQESGEKVCTRCGAVSLAESGSYELALAEQSSRGPAGGSRSFTAIERVGVDTYIGAKDVDAGGKRIGRSRDLQQLRRLNTMVAWDSKRRRLGKVSMEVQRVAQSLGLNPSLGERAFRIYLREFQSKSVKTRSLAAASVACVCMACRELDVPRPPNELVAKLAGIDERKFRHYYKALLATEAARSVPSPANYVSTIAAKASLQPATERRAIEILHLVKGDSRLVGKRPISLAAAALYIASLKCGEGTTQLRIAYAASVTPITIRKRSQEISDILAAPRSA